MENLTINDVHGLTEMTVDLVKKVGNKFVRVNNSAAKNVVDLQIGGREVKLEGDKLLEEPILKELQKTGYAILSEETGYILASSCLACFGWSILWTAVITSVEVLGQA